MTQKHTQGPWIVDEDFRAGMSWNRHIVQEANPDMRICFMTSDGKKEDAALIASAPDLLVALKGMMQVDPTREDWERAHAAIAKATVQS